LPPKAISAAVDELTRDRSAMSLEAADREVYRLLKEGIPDSVMERDSTSGRAELPLRPNTQGGAAKPPYQKGGQTTVRVRVIDWEQPANNDFLLVSQFSVTGAWGKCRMTSSDCRTD
jgi:type I restriction enzyme R subunit